MKRAVLLTLIVFGFLFISLSSVHAQMMSGNTYPTPAITSSDIQSQQQEENEGKTVLDELNTKSITCSQVTDTQFEKIGEYVMAKSFSGDTASHIAANNRMKSMMGDQGEEQMHINIGKQTAGCNNNGNANLRGGGNTMMGWGYGNNGMMGGNFGAFSILALLFWLVGFIDLVLVGIWLWQKIKK